MKDLLTFEFIKSYFTGFVVYSLTAQKLFEKVKKEEFDEDVSVPLKLAVMAYIDAEPGHNAAIAFEKIRIILRKGKK